MELLTPSETKYTKSSANGDKPAAEPTKRSSLTEKTLKNVKSEEHLPPIGKDSSQKNIKLAYSLTNDAYKNHLLIEEPFQQRPEIAGYVAKIQNVSMIPSNQRGLIMNQKVGSSTGPKAAAKGKRRVRPPKTQFKIMKTNANIDKLESVLVDFIDKNKLLRSSNDEIIMRPQNRMQAAINSLRAVNKILPQSNIVQHKFGYDEANLSKNHLILEKVMLERITKTKMRRQEERFAREQSEVTKNVQNTQNVQNVQGQEK